MLHPVTSSSWIPYNHTGLCYSERAWQILMTWITQVQRKMTAAMKLSSLHFSLFIFHWEVSPGRTLSVLTLHVSSKHLSTIYLQNAHLFSDQCQSQCSEGGDDGNFLGSYGIRPQCQQVVANKQTMDEMKLIIFFVLFSLFEQAIGSIGIPSHNSFLAVNAQWLIWHTYQVFGSWDVGAQQGQWGDVMAFPCCWADCLS